MVMNDALLTAEQFAVLPETNRLTELVCGRIVSTDLPGFRHGLVCTNIAFQLGEYVGKERIGTTVLRSGVVTRRNPDSVRGPDVSYYSFNRIPPGEIPAGYPAQPPELVFEVKSPCDNWDDLLAKKAEYLRAGVVTVCVANPEDETASVFSAYRKDAWLDQTALLTLPELLPGLAIPVSRFFHAA